MDIASLACEDKESLPSAHLRNTAGNAYSELNDLGQSRLGFETARSIRESRLDPNDCGVAHVLANFGNVESAEGNLEEARALFQQAAVIRERIGDTAATLSALIYLQLGRVDYLEGDFAVAYKQYQGQRPCLCERLDLRAF